MDAWVCSECGGENIKEIDNHSEGCEAADWFCEDCNRIEYPNLVKNKYSRFRITLNIGLEKKFYYYFEITNIELSKCKTHNEKTILIEQYAKRKFEEKVPFNWEEVEERGD